MKHQFRADFIKTLFSQKDTSEDTLISWGERLGFNVIEPHYVLAIEIELDPAWMPAKKIKKKPAGNQNIQTIPMMR